MMSNHRTHDLRATARPARLALALPDAGSSGVVDVADLRAEAMPWSLAPPGPPPQPARPPRWPLAGLLTAVAASAMVVALAATFEPAPTVVVRQQAPDRHLSMQGVAVPEGPTAIEPDPEAQSKRADATEAAPEPALEEDAEATKADAPAAKATSRSKATNRSKSTKTRSTRTTTVEATPTADPSIPIECVLDPSRCTASGQPRKTGGTSRGKPLPDKLTASQLKAALASTKASARQCGPEHGADAGTGVQVKLSIEGTTGSVVSATPRGEHAGTSLGACVARALSRTEFPRFSAARMGTLYTVRL